MDSRRWRRDMYLRSPQIEPPKRTTRVHAQRKFATTSTHSAPLKELKDLKEKVTVNNEGKNKDSRYPTNQPKENVVIRPKTEDFLTFLCFRGTSVLPPHLACFESPQFPQRWRRPKSIPVPPAQEEKFCKPTVKKVKEEVVKKECNSMDSLKRNIEPIHVNISSTTHAARVTRSSASLTPTPSFLSSPQSSECSPISSQRKLSRDQLLLKKAMLIKSNKAIVKKRNARILLKKKQKLETKPDSSRITRSFTQVPKSPIMVCRKTVKASHISKRKKSLCRMLKRIGIMGESSKSTISRKTRSQTDEDSQHQLPKKISSSPEVKMKAETDVIKETVQSKSLNIILKQKPSRKRRRQLSTNCSLSPTSSNCLDKSDLRHSLDRRISKKQKRSVIKLETSNKYSELKIKDHEHSPRKRKCIINKSNLANNIKIEQESLEPNNKGRPARKTKQVAEVYLKLVSQKLAKEAEVGLEVSDEEDNISISSIKELKAVVKAKNKLDMKKCVKEFVDKHDSQNSSLNKSSSPMRSRSNSEGSPVKKQLVKRNLFSSDTEDTENTMAKSLRDRSKTISGELRTRSKRVDSKSEPIIIIEEPCVRLNRYKSPIRNLTSPKISKSPSNEQVIQNNDSSSIENIGTFPLQAKVSNKISKYEDTATTRVRSVCKKSATISSKKLPSNLKIASVNLRKIRSDKEIRRMATQFLESRNDLPVPKAKKQLSRKCNRSNSSDKLENIKKEKSDSQPSNSCQIRIRRALSLDECNSNGKKIHKEYLLKEKHTERPSPSKALGANCISKMDCIREKISLPKHFKKPIRRKSFHDDTQLSEVLEKIAKDFEKQIDIDSCIKLENDLNSGKMSPKKCLKSEFKCAKNDSNSLPSVDSPVNQSVSLKIPKVSSTKCLNDVVKTLMEKSREVVDSPVETKSSDENKTVSEMRSQSQCSGTPAPFSSPLREIQPKPVFKFNECTNQHCTTNSPLKNVTLEMPVMNDSAMPPIIISKLPEEHDGSKANSKIVPYIPEVPKTKFPPSLEIDCNLQHSNNINLTVTKSLPVPFNAHSIVLGSSTTLSMPICQLQPAVLPPALGHITPGITISQPIITSINDIKSNKNEITPTKSSSKQILIAPKPSKNITNMSAINSVTGLKHYQKPIAPKVLANNGSQQVPVSHFQSATPILTTPAIGSLVQTIQHPIQTVQTLPQALHNMQAIPQGVQSIQALNQTFPTIGPTVQRVMPHALPLNAAHIGTPSSPAKLITPPVFVSSVPNMVAGPFDFTVGQLPASGITPVSQLMGQNVVGKVIPKSQPSIVTPVSHPLVTIGQGADGSILSSFMPLNRQGQPQFLTVMPMPMGATPLTVPATAFPSGTVNMPPSIVSSQSIPMLSSGISALNNVLTTNMNSAIQNNSINSFSSVVNTNSTVYSSAPLQPQNIINSKPVVNEPFIIKVPTASVVTSSEVLNYRFNSNSCVHNNKNVCSNNIINLDGFTDKEIQSDDSIDKEIPSANVTNEEIVSYDITDKEMVSDACIDKEILADNLSEKGVVSDDVSDKEVISNDCTYKEMVPNACADKEMEPDTSIDKQDIRSCKEILSSDELTKNTDQVIEKIPSNENKTNNIPQNTVPLNLPLSCQVSTSLYSPMKPSPALTQALAKLYPSIETTTALEISCPSTTSYSSLQINTHIYTHASLISPQNRECGLSRQKAVTQVSQSSPPYLLSTSSYDAHKSIKVPVYKKKSNLQGKSTITPNKKDSSVQKIYKDKSVSINKNNNNEKDVAKPCNNRQINENSKETNVPLLSTKLFYSSKDKEQLDKNTPSIPCKKGNKLFPESSTSALLNHKCGTISNKINTNTKPGTIDNKLSLPNSKLITKNNTSVTTEKQTSLKSVRSQKREPLLKKTLLKHKSMTESKSVDAFSALNESSVYAFEPDLDSIDVSTPFPKRLKKGQSLNEEVSNIKKSNILELEVNLSNLQQIINKNESLEKIEPEICTNMDNVKPKNINLKKIETDKKVNLAKVEQNKNMVKVGFNKSINLEKEEPNKIINVKKTEINKSTLEKLESNRNANLLQVETKKNIYLEKVEPKKNMNLDKVEPKKNINLEKVEPKKNINLEKVEPKKNINLEKVEPKKNINLEKAEATKTVSLEKIELQKKVNLENETNINIYLGQTEPKKIQNLENIDGQKNTSLRRVEPKKNTAINRFAKLDLSQIEATVKMDLSSSSSIENETDEDDDAPVEIVSIAPVYSNSSAEEEFSNDLSIELNKEQLSNDLVIELNKDQLLMNKNSKPQKSDNSLRSVRVNQSTIEKPSTSLPQSNNLKFMRNYKLNLNLKRRTVARIPMNFSLSQAMDRFPPNSIQKVSTANNILASKSQAATNIVMSRNTLGTSMISSPSKLGHVKSSTKCLSNMLVKRKSQTNVNKEKSNEGKVKNSKKDIKKCNSSIKEDKGKNTKQPVQSTSVAIQCDLDDNSNQEETNPNESGTQTDGPPKLPLPSSASPFYYLPLAMATLGEELPAQLVQQMLAKTQGLVGETEAKMILRQAAQLAQQYHKNIDPEGVPPLPMTSSAKPISPKSGNIALQKVLKATFGEVGFEGLENSFSAEAKRKNLSDSKENNSNCSLNTSKDTPSKDKTISTDTSLLKISDNSIPNSLEADTSIEKPRQIDEELKVDDSSQSSVDMKKKSKGDSNQLNKTKSELVVKRRSGRSSTSASTKATEFDINEAEEIRRSRRARRAAASLAREEGWSSSSEAPLSPTMSPDSLRGWPPTRLTSPTPSYSSEGTTSSTPSRRSCMSVPRSRRQSPVIPKSHRNNTLQFSTDPVIDPGPLLLSESTSLTRAPSFFPTEDEFNEPLDYIEKIRPEAEHFGLCRIVPPGSFRPECRVNDDMRFTATKQYIHRVMNRWGRNTKVMSAIRMCLTKQKIELQSNILIGTLELDLVRLYEVVEEMGGLMKVIENELWAKVADSLRIPKSTQDRLTKLDSIYCKYLLPYAMLSEDERKKLLAEVEEEHNLETRKESHSDDEDDDIDEFSEFVVKGKSTALSAFYRVSKNVASQWQPDPDGMNIDERYWNIVKEGARHVCVHTASIDTAEHGYGFPSQKNSHSAKHPWNLKNICQNPSSILRSMANVIGVSAPTLHVGMMFSTVCWYRDPHSLPWIEYLHTGSRKIWYGVPSGQEKAMKEALNQIVPEVVKDSPLWLPSDTTMIPPDILIKKGLKVSRIAQEPGQFVVVFPGAFTSSVCSGYVISESAFYARPQYFNRAVCSFQTLRECREPAMFSLDRLSLSVASDSKASLESLQKARCLVDDIVKREKQQRKELTELGLKASDRLPHSGSYKKKKGRYFEDEENLCEVCKQHLYVSMVSYKEEDEEIGYCIEHAISHLKSQPEELNLFKLLYTYTLPELTSMLKQMDERIDQKGNKKPTVKRSKLMESMDSFSSTSGSNF